ncbi:hypothetical protein RchiOBHm_Chr6g0288101 [Rosa chinensis]|uniref:Uncharacterized protein n=1 Tax=Rosa chinensis TaxID=74649 RepID=A0A2P6PV87_ROSCH|nr:hypothetical protein RchiOBHm_Chr6g0288101 [Rosa chinensis]
MEGKIWASTDLVCWALSLWLLFWATLLVFFFLVSFFYPIIFFYIFFIIENYI